MRVVACFDVSPEPQDIQVRPDRTLDLGRAKPKIGAYALHAIEAACVLAAAAGGEAVGLTAGELATVGNPKLRKDALSRGLDRLVAVAVPDAADLDSFQTASVLAAALAQMGQVDLVLAGAGSSGQYSQQVGNQLGALLGWPTLNAVNSVALGEQPAASVVVERLLEGAAQVAEVTLPAVLTLTSGINVPRIAGMRDILAAGKKPVEELELTPPPAAATILSVLAPPAADRARVLIEADAATAAARLAEYLREPS
ncbi:MAG: hypothetical protein LBL01_01365 [Bifidobacteriaceae bacterium]|jgi:electron transfer flavoprotein beta subunit|nr:hypothetical protein [Bifidobacteriaceae bacterium]